MNGTTADELSEILAAWAEQFEKYHNGDINGRSIKDKLKD